MQNGAFFFDLDGTLIDTERVTLRAWAYFWSSVCDQPFPSAQMEDWIGLTEDAFAARVHQVFAPTTDITVLRQGFDEVFEEIVERDGVPLLSGAREVLVRICDAGFGLGLASNSDRLYVDRMLAMHDLTSFFSHTITRDDVSAPKPAPDMYERLRSLMPAAFMCAVEDSVTGVAGAQAAGLMTVGVIGSGSRKLVERAQLILPSLCEFNPEDVMRRLSVHI